MVISFTALLRGAVLWTAGDGVVNKKDLNLVRQRFGLRLPRQAATARPKAVESRPRPMPAVRMVLDRPGAFHRKGHFARVGILVNLTILSQNVTCKRRSYLGHLNWMGFRTKFVGYIGRISQAGENMIGSVIYLQITAPIRLEVI